MFFFQILRKSGNVGIFRIFGILSFLFFATIGRPEEDVVGVAVAAAVVAAAAAAEVV